MFSPSIPTIPTIEEPKIYYSDSRKAFYRSDIHKDLPDDIIEVTHDQHQQLLMDNSQGKVITVVDGVVVSVTPPIDIKALFKSLEYVTQKHLDEFAKQKGYDNIISVCTYATSSNIARALEGQKAVDNRDLVWDHYFSKLELYTQPNAVLPTVEEYIATLPVLSW